MHPEVLAALAAAPADAALLVVANLPYSLSGPLLAELAGLDRLPDRAVLMLQKELAERVAAPAGSPAAGGLSVVLQAAFEPRILRTLPPAVFRPRPKVESAILLLERRSGPPRPAADRRRLGAFVRALFQQRRKTLRATLPRAAAAIGGALPAGLDPGLLLRRAEALSWPEVVSLCDRVAGAPEAPRTAGPAAKKNGPKNSGSEWPAAPSPTP
jgi:16S rRNA (adenine1518-N6/adenine1519-N6)-dimethyltransferase